jgi:WD40 repeat protein
LNWSNASDRWLVSAGKNPVANIWDTTTGKVACSLKRHTNDIMAAVFSHDDTRLFTLSLDKTLIAW